VRFLYHKETIEVKIIPEIIASHLAEHITTTRFDTKIHAMNKSNFLGFIGEELTRRYVLPKLCSNYDYAVYFITNAKSVQEAVIRKVVDKELKNVELPQMFQQNLEYLVKLFNDGTTEIPIYVYKDLSEYIGLIVKCEIFNSLISSLAEYLRILKIRSTLFPLFYSKLFDFVCLSLSEVLRKSMLKLKIYECTKSVFYPTMISKGICKPVMQEELEVLIPRYEINRVRFIEVKTTSRSSDDVINEARWDMKRKIESIRNEELFLRLIEKGNLDAYLIFVRLTSDLRNAVISVYEFNVPR